ncbi:unnamed protein product [Symbiodinium pilosum]|uniref:GRF-type domain-containing protein n=1 Tax=Symbiodinium pilosum TaxID=2952 RepID=A0A812QPL5_SYMPI|nr:unnamed protein product [Symbiodinium pilosum]
MATVAASTDAAVPDDDDLSEDEAEEPMDPWASYERPPGFSPAASGGRPESALQGSTGRGGQLDTEFAMFEEFVRRREATRPRGRRTSTGDDDDDDQSGRGSAGPPPAWDGTSTFKDYLVRARLWLATTKAKPRSRGPMLLKNLSGTPFDDLKYLARDAAWMNAEDNAEQMLKIMDTKELYGDDAREDMLNTLYKITYALRREKGESYKTFFSRWENCVRRLTEHDVALPAEYLGFLLTMALQLSSEEVKLLMNFTQGKLNQKDVKEWVRVNETNLKLGATGTSRRNNQVLHVEDASDQDDAEDSDSVEVLMNAMESLEDPIQDADADETEPFDEADAKDILSTMIKEHAKGTVKRTFKAVNDAKRAKGLARGYSAARDIGGKFQGGKGGDYVKTGESYRISIDALKRRTRCAHCKKKCTPIMLPAQVRTSAPLPVTPVDCANMETQNKRARHPEDHRAHLSWRRMTLHLLVVIADAVQKAMLRFLGTRGPKQVLRQQMMDLVEVLSLRQLGELNQLVHHAIAEGDLADLTDEENWEVLSEILPEDVPPPSQRKRTSTAMGSQERVHDSPMFEDKYDETIEVCYCDLPRSMLRTHKAGANKGRLFYRCHQWRFPSRRCTYFEWLPDHEQDTWSNAPWGPPTPVDKRSPNRKSPPRPAPSSRGSTRRSPPPSPVVENETPEEINNRQPGSRSSTTTNRTTTTRSPTPPSTTAGECPHRNVTNAGSNAWVRQARCVDCGQVLRRESTEFQKTYYRDRGVELRPPKTLPNKNDDAKPKQPAPTRSPTARSSGERTPQQDYEEYQEFLRFRAMRDKSSAANHPKRG